MAVARLVLTKIEGKFNEGEKFESGGKLSVSTNSRVDPVEIEEIGKQKVATVKWGLDIEYSPAIGKIVIEGKVYVAGDVSKVTEKSGSRISLVAEEARQVHQTILRMPLVVAVNVARELNMPLPMNFPVVEVASDASSKAKSK